MSAPATRRKQPSDDLPPDLARVVEAIARTLAREDFEKERAERGLSVHRASGETVTP